MTTRVVKTTTSFMTRSSTAFKSALASFLHQLPGRVDIVISVANARHTLVDIVVANPTRCSLMERATRQDLVAATDAD